jgi:carbonic anhydrase/acetyltransferase-like protein (isoleucine patch superfamily)
MEKPDDGDKKPKSLLGQTGPVRIGGGQLGEKHLFTTTGKPGYTQGSPYQEEKYVTNIIGEDYKVPTETPASVKSGATMPHMGVKEHAPAPMPEPPAPTPVQRGIHVKTGYDKWSPSVDPSAAIDPRSSVRGNVLVGKEVCVAEEALISCHEEEPIVLADGCAVFEGAVITVLPVRAEGAKKPTRLVNVGGVEYPVYVGERSVIAPGASITGPCYIGRGCLVGAGSQVFWAKVGDGVIIEPGAFVMNVEVPPGYFVPAGMRLTEKETVTKLPQVTSRYRFRGLAEEMLQELRKRYSG